MRHGPLKGIKPNIIHEVGYKFKPSPKPPQKFLSMATFHLNSQPLFNNVPKIHSSLKPNLSNSNNNYKPITTKTPPPRDRIIDFGKHKGRMLGTLPSTYLKWVSKNLRAQDYEIWANLADQVLVDPVYKDRIEWEFADGLLNGNSKNLSSSSLSDEKSGGSGSRVDELFELSKRFGWDNDDKIGWSRIDFQLLGTSKTGRIPRICSRDGIIEDGLKLGREEFKEVKQRSENGGGGGGGGREERRERLKLRRGGGSGGGVVRKGGGGEIGDRERSREERTVEIWSPFPGRESLLKKVLDRKKVI